jgi:hypothetical protein
MFLHHRAGERAEQQEPLVALGQPDGVCPPSSWRVARPSGRSLPHTRRSRPSARRCCRWCR